MYLALAGVIRAIDFHTWICHSNFFVGPEFHTKRRKALLQIKFRQKCLFVKRWRSGRQRPEQNFASTAKKYD